MKKILPIIAIIIIIASFGVTYKLIKKEATPLVTNFEECVKAGNPAIKSYPRQCRHENQTFIEYIGNELEKADLIRIDYPRPNQIVQSPLTITGEARGYWFFEASFPVTLTDWNGKIIAQGIATAKSDWMTSELTPFEATLAFMTDKNAPSNKGMLILRKDNPSGLPEHDDALLIPVVLAEVSGSPKACTQEAKLCPDGSYVARIGPNCEFAPCPSTGISCIKDSDCPSTQYVCQEIQGAGTVCSSTDLSCVPTYAITQGECKLKENVQCGADSDCASGNLCIKNICANPIGRQCAGPSDTSCPADFECVQDCGPPVARYPDDTPPSYFCQLQGYIRPCPICLAKNTLIDTPLGAIAAQAMRKGASVWTVDNSGKRVLGEVVEISKTPVPPDHKMVKLVFEDGRALLVSPGHPTIDGRVAGDLATGDLYDGVLIISSNRVAYDDSYTYDILPSGETGFYFANGILLDSTLRQSAEY